MRRATNKRLLNGSFEHSICPRGHFVTPGSTYRHPITGADFCRPCVNQSSRDSERRRRLGLRCDFAEPDIPAPPRLTSTGRTAVRMAVANGAELHSLAIYFETTISEIRRATVTSDLYAEGF